MATPRFAITTLALMRQGSHTNLVLFLDVKGAGRLIAFGVAGAETRHLFDIEIDGTKYLDATGMTVPAGQPGSGNPAFVVESSQGGGNGSIQADARFESQLTVRIGDDGKWKSWPRYWVSYVLDLP